MHPNAILLRHGVSPKKSLGQNFLYDDQLLAKIAAAAGLSTADNVLEIGPGLGSLTKHLALAAGRVTAVELDERLAPILSQELAAFYNVTLIQGDILGSAPDTFFPGEPYKVVANVPYYITGAIIRHLLDAARRPALIVFTVQKEVAQRLTAKPGDMSLFAVSVQCYGAVELFSRIQAGAFWPRPAVDSSLIRIDLHGPPAFKPDEKKRFFSLVRAGFAHKRKQLQKNLRALGFSRQQIDHSLAVAGIERRRRAESLSLDEWVMLLRALPAAAGKDAGATS